MAYKPIQIGQINTTQVSAYSAKPAEIVFDDQINKLHLGGIDAKLKGVQMDNENAWATCATAASTTAKVATASDFALKIGTRVAVKFTYANTATAPTLNVNSTGAKALKKANGAAFTNVVAGGVYTFIYDGTNFIIQGEGGEYGTASATDVRKGKTIGTESGIVTGTLDLSKLIASNIKEGVTIDGVTGNLAGTKIATGTATASNNVNGYITLAITGLAFTPRIVVGHAAGKEAVFIVCSDSRIIQDNIRNGYTGGSPTKIFENGSFSMTEAYATNNSIAPGATYSYVAIE